MVFGHPTIDRLSRLVDGMLRTSEEEALNKHLEACSQCYAKEQALIRVRMILQTLPAIEEGLVMKEPPVPMPVIIGRLVFERGLAIGLLVGIILIGAMALWIPQPALKVISGNSPTNFVGPQRISENQQVQTGEALRTLPSGHVDLEIPDRVFLRLKPGTTITWQQLDRPFFFRKPLIIVNLMRGELLGRTKDAFWGSNMIIRTPTANAFIKGTAFGVKVDSKQDATTLKVIAGSVFFSPYMNNIGVHVNPGETSRIQEEKMPERPAQISVDDWEQMFETFQIGDQSGSQPVALMIGIGPTRVEELLRPAFLYVSNWEHPQLQPFLRKVLKELNAALLRGDPMSQNNNLKILEVAAANTADEDISVVLQLFAGAYSLRLDNPWRAHYHFRLIVEKYPWHPLASLSLAALALSADRRGDRVNAEENFRAILSKYPKSQEAVYATKYLQEHGYK